MKVRVYVEGGGDGRELRARCRAGFSSFLEKANLAGRMPGVIACGGRRNAFEKFCIALGASKEEQFIVLLVDSEGPVADGYRSWLHLKTRDGWDRPHDATDEHAHLMVQCMEAWFLADKDGLAAYFGRGFNRNALPRRPEYRRGSQVRRVRQAEERYPPMQDGRIWEGTPLLRHLGTNRSRQGVGRFAACPAPGRYLAREVVLTRSVARRVAKEPGKVFYEPPWEMGWSAPLPLRPQMGQGGVFHNSQERGGPRTGLPELGLTWARTRFAGAQWTQGEILFGARMST